MQFDLWTFGFQTANFLVLVWLLNRYLYRPVLHVVAARKQAADKVLADARAAHDAAEALRGELETRRRAMDAERDSVLGAARSAAEEERKTILEGAARSAEAARAAAAAGIEAERADAVRSLGREAARLAASMARRLAEAVDPAALQSGFVARVCGDLRDMPAEARAGVAERLAGAGRGLKVVTAAPLDGPGQAALTEKLAAALGASVRPEFDVDPGLIVGVEVHFPFTILRRTWAADLQRLSSELAHDDGAQKRA